MMQNKKSTNVSMKSLVNILYAFLSVTDCCRMYSSYRDSRGPKQIVYGINENEFPNIVSV